MDVTETSTGPRELAVRARTADAEGATSREADGNDEAAEASREARGCDGFVSVGVATSAGQCLFC